MSRGVANWLPVQIPQDKLVDPWKFFYIGLKLGIKSGWSSLISMRLHFHEISVRKFHSTIVLSDIEGTDLLIRQNDTWKFFQIGIKSEVAFLFQYPPCNSTRFLRKIKVACFFTLCYVESYKNQNYCQSALFLHYNLKCPPLLNMNWGCRGTSVAIRNKSLYHDFI